MSHALAQWALFGLGPFYAYPWKIAIHKFVGHSYEIALKHFKTGHYGATNLFGHFACLFVQLFGNFGLLRVIDTKFLPQIIPGVRLLSTQTAVIWSLYLLRGSAPLIVKLLSVLAIAATYFAVPSVTFQAYEMAGLALYCSAMLAGDLVFSKKKIGLKGWVRVALIPAMAAGWRALEASSIANVASTGNSQLGVTAGTLSILTALSLVKNPIKKVVIVGMIISRLASILTGRIELAWLGFAFTASFMQGITHNVTNEQATLIALGDKGGKDELESEYAHVVFFPNILLHTILDKLTKVKE